MLLGFPAHFPLPMKYLIVTCHKDYIHSTVNNKYPITSQTIREIICWTLILLDARDLPHIHVIMITYMMYCYINLDV